MFHYKGTPVFLGFFIIIGRNTWGMKNMVRRITHQDNFHLNTIQLLKLRKATASRERLVTAIII